MSCGFLLVVCENYIFLFLSFVACGSVVVCGVLLDVCGSELGLQPKPGFNGLESRFQTQVFDRFNPGLQPGPYLGWIHGSNAMFQIWFLELLLIWIGAGMDRGS